MKLAERYRSIANLLVLAAFVLCGITLGWSPRSSGDDLSASYIGCRLVSSGEAQTHLYRHDPIDFSAIGPDDPWQDAADRGGFTGSLHPYVQTPLWAYALQPLCRRTDFAHFERYFDVFTMLCFALTVWMTARYWAPSLLHPAALAVVLLLLGGSEPFRYALFLMQTHILFLCLSIAGLILAEHEQPAWAGLLVAVAASVKLTPGLILLYWLMTRRWKAAAWLVGWLGTLSLLTIATTGLPLFRIYLRELSRVGGILLLSLNNQSLAAWWMGRFYPAAEAASITIYPLPASLRLVGLGLMVAFTALGANFDRRPLHDQGAPPRSYGAVMVLLAGMLFAPIAWSHYSILLVVPLMIFADVAVRTRSRPLAWSLTALIVLVLALSYPPLAPHWMAWNAHRFETVRGLFYAGVLCLGGCAWLGWQRKLPMRQAAAS